MPLARIKKIMKMDEEVKVHYFQLFLCMLRALIHISTAIQPLKSGHLSNKAILSHKNITYNYLKVDMHVLLT